MSEEEASEDPGLSLLPLLPTLDEDSEGLVLKGIPDSGEELCPTYHFLCEDQLTCLPYHKLCDDNIDCPQTEITNGGEDEQFQSKGEEEGSGCFPPDEYKPPPPNTETEEEPESGSDAEEEEPETESESSTETETESSAETEPESSAETEPESSAETEPDDEAGSGNDAEAEEEVEEAESAPDNSTSLLLLPQLPALEETPLCQGTDFGCCPDSSLPAHGPLGEGCCLGSLEGCCPDFIRLKEDGCSCEESLHGCCSDGVTARLGEGVGGCGCKESEHGCCQDQYTAALGPALEGCPCGTSDYGCCEDGQTVAQGPNGEGCLGCQATEHGCCPGGFTPNPGDETGCGCSGSVHGCCPDGQTEADGEDFEGCEERPGEACHLSKDGGQGENFTVLWYFDVTEGRCSRFWYGGEGGNKNAFLNQEDCEGICVSPPGSAMCYLPKAEGICKGSNEMWHYDPKYKQCNTFIYGGCLGTANRFSGREQCERTCVKTASLSVCEQPLDPGPCRGEERRWYYDDQQAVCSNFTYGGCQGNKNRFMTKEACDNSCGHEAQLKEATRICKQVIDAGSCEEEEEEEEDGYTEARWGFSEEDRSCTPFYWSGCGGNQNSFVTRDECRSTCPNAFPPELEVITKILNIEEGGEALLRVNVSGNPSPDVTWRHGEEDVGWDDRVEKMSDHSVRIVSVVAEDAGTWTITVNNGLGQVVRRQVSLTVYPSSIPITVTVPEVKTEYKAGEEITMSCQVEGYPVPVVRWLKNNAPLPRSQRILVTEGNTLVIKRASPIDSGSYMCRASNKNSAVLEVVEVTVEQGVIPLECTDMPGLANCARVVQARQCSRSAALQRICCQSCHEAGQTDGLP